MTTDLTIDCAECGKKMSVTERMWFINMKTYCMSCGLTERKSNA